MAVSFFALIKELRSYRGASEDKNATVKFEIVGKIEQNDMVVNELNLLFQPGQQVSVTVMTEDEVKEAIEKRKHEQKKVK
jgi:hypothetical protein